MEEKKVKKKLNKKPLLICLAIALVFAVIGFVDIKVNAAEGKNLEIKKFEKDSSGNVTESTWFSTALDYNEDYELYWYSTSDTFHTGYYEYALYVVSKQHSSLGTDYDYAFTMNNEIYYVTILHNASTSFSISSGYYEPRIEGVTVTRIDKFYYHADFVSDYLSGVIQPDIDYDSFEIDDEMSIIQNLLYNIIRNEKPSANDTTGLGIIKDVEYYEYLTWNNTKKLPIQVEYVPIVQVYSGLIKETFKKEYYGEWTDFEILPSDTNSYTKRTDSEYLFENDRVGKDFENEILDTYVEYGDNTYLFYGYRLRYVDEDSKLCSPWVYAVPRENGTYYSYVEYSDCSTTNDEDITGTDNTYDNIDDIENAKTDIDKENEVKNEYEIVDNDVDVKEAINWLNTVVSFIKGTPSIVASVLSFLPQPILYGMYVTLFLGVIASAIAIIKALF